MVIGRPKTASWNRYSMMVCTCGVIFSDGEFNWSRQHFILYRKNRGRIMTYRTRIKYTAEQKAEMWDRWQRGESLNSIGPAFDRPSSSIFSQLAALVATLVTTSGISRYWQNKDSRKIITRMMYYLGKDIRKMILGFISIFLNTAFPFSSK